jgi:inorganic pyrophosphatase
MVRRSDKSPKAKGQNTSMDLKHIPAGKNPPHDINVVIEIPLGGAPIKYEVDKESGAMFVDRFLHTAMFYPANYGFVPHTLSDDGDPVDVMVVSTIGVTVGAVMRSRPIGVLLMEDESGKDEKILAVPHSKLHPFYDEVQSYSDLPPILLQQIEHFFAHYKDLEPGKWVKVTGWGDAAAAARVIQDGIEKATNKGKKKAKKA